MKYKLPPLPLAKSQYGFDNTLAFCATDMRQYAEQAVAPLLAEIERLEDLLHERGVADSLE